jgi:hypothetical protein
VAKVNVSLTLDVEIINHIDMVREASSRSLEINDALLMLYDIDKALAPGQGAYA